LDVTTVKPEQKNYQISFSKISKVLRQKFPKNKISIQVSSKTQTSFYIVEALS